jgi:hypothetical protein
MIEILSTKQLKKDIKQWIKDYEHNKEHDIDLTVALKDDAYGLLSEAFERLK